MDENRKRKLETEEDSVVNSSENEMLSEGLIPEELIPQGLNPEELNLEELNDMIENNNENEEMSDHLRQFDVLDEVQGDESGSENGDIDRKGKMRL